MIRIKDHMGILKLLRRKNMNKKVTIEEETLGIIIEIHIIIIKEMIETTEMTEMGVTDQIITTETMRTMGTIRTEIMVVIATIGIKIKIFKKKFKLLKLSKKQKKSFKLSRKEGSAGHRP